MDFQIGIRGVSSLRKIRANICCKVFVNLTTLLNCGKNELTIAAGPVEPTSVRSDHRSDNFLDKILVLIQETNHGAQAVHAQTP